MINKDTNVQISYCRMKPKAKYKYNEISAHVSTSENIKQILRHAVVYTVCIVYPVRHMSIHTCVMYDSYHKLYAIYRCKGYFKMSDHLILSQERRLYRSRERPQFESHKKLNE